MRRSKCVVTLSMYNIKKVSRGEVSFCAEANATPLYLGCPPLFLDFVISMVDVLRFDLPYDKLVIAVGSKSATFGVPGFASQEETLSTEGATSASSPLPPSKPLGSETGTDHHNVFFLKQLQHARAIRNRILECFERASNPLVDPSERCVEAELICMICNI